MHCKLACTIGLVKDSDRWDFIACAHGVILPLSVGQRTFVQQTFEVILDPSLGHLRVSPSIGNLDSLFTFEDL
jgi:hypothetical protein